MRIMIVGAGYVGLVSGICFAEFGFNVTCVDIDAAKIHNLQHGKLPIYEPGLEELLSKNLVCKNLSFSTDLIASMQNKDLIFLAIGTPSNNSGAVDLSYITQAIHDIAPHLHQYTPIVIKSTVPPGTCRGLKQQILQINPDAQFDIISNPEFLREGVAVRDFMQPDRIIVGLDNQQNRDTMAKLYRPLYLQNVPIVYTSLESAELIKYAANALLATKIAFINEMADLCEKIEADIQTVAHGIGLDKRIGPQFLQTGPGYGGSCFPKDTLGLQSFASTVQVPVQIIDAVIKANNFRKINCLEKVRAVFKHQLVGVELAVLGVAFKANTDDIRESPALPIIQGLINDGANVRLFDPQAMHNAEQYLGAPNNLRYCKTLKECLCNAHAVLILTEWPEFKTFNLNDVANLLSNHESAPKILIDLRNLYSPNDFTGLNMRYVSLGRPVYEPSITTLKVDMHEH